MAQLNGSGDVDYRDRRAAPSRLRFSTLGAVSAGLGIALLMRPNEILQAIGLDDDATAVVIARAVGGRELMAAGGLMLRRHPRRWTWARVAGDAIDISLMVAALQRKETSQQRALIATGALAAITLGDLVTAVRAQRSPFVGGAAAVRARSAVTVNRPVHEVYSAWRDLERLPEFMEHLVEVRADGAQMSHWKAKAPGGRTVEWDAEIVADSTDSLIAWRSTPEARVRNRGSVRFSSAPGSRGTVVAVDLQYEPPAGAAGAIVARMLGEEPVQQMKDDLRRFKQMMETGEIARSDATPEGHRALRQAMQRPGQPAEAGRRTAS
jgi:uncharacterized membrane protein